MPPTQQNEIITWTDANGNVTPLAWLFAQNDPSVVWGRSGAYMPIPLYAKYVSPAQDGAIVKFLRWQERELDLTVELWCDDINILKQRMGALTQALKPSKGLGKLTFTHETGESRYLNCNLLKGMEGVEPLEYGAGFVGRMIWVFESPDVYFYSPLPATAQTITVSGGAGAVTTGTTYTQTTTLTNAGDETTWPVWTITVPHSVSRNNSNSFSVNFGVGYTITVTLTNQTTGQYFTVVFVEVAPNFFVNAHTTTVAASLDTVRAIDTQISVKTVKDGSGTPIPTALTFKNMFPLVPGDNVMKCDITVPAPGGGSGYVDTYSIGTSTVSMVYKPTYLAIT